jgi:hypothetical protein
MNPKPPITRTGRSGWLGYRAKRLKSLTVVGAVTLGFAGAAFAAAAPASADPAFTYVAVGSDTIQDVMNGFAFTTGGEAGGGVLASYNATNPTDLTLVHENITPVKNIAGTSTVNCSFTRPNGSTEGFNALDKSFNTSSSLTQLTTPPGPGCIDISRSSSGPGINGSGPGALDSSGGLVYIPFALDAVAGASGPPAAVTGQTIECTTANDANCVNGFDTNYTVPATNIAQASMFTQTELTTLYSCVPGTSSPNDFVAVNGVNYFPNGDAPTGVSGDVNIDLYAPQAGSGTLKFWASKLSFSATAPPACVHQQILAGPAKGLLVEEHDGTAYASDPNGYGPFSIAQWLAQSHGIDDRRHSAQLQSINAVAPLNTSGKLNTAFPFIREVFDVMQYGAVVSGAGITGQTFDPVLSGLFATTGSALCQNTFLIQKYGFAVLPTSGGPTPDQCGATTASLRVQETNSGPN